MCAKKKQILLSVCLAFYIFLCAGSTLFLNEALWPPLNAAEAAAVFLAFVFLCYFGLFPFDKRRMLITCGAGALMGVMTLLGTRYVRDIDLSKNLFCFIAVLLALTLLYGITLSLIFRYVPVLAGRFPQLTRTLPPKYQGVRVFLTLYLITGVIYFITFLAVYPGIYTYDASVQVLQVFGNEPMTTHHPVLHTWFFCGLLQLGRLLFGGYLGGMALHSIVQAAIMGAVFCYAIWRMIRRGYPLIFIIFAYLMLVVNPYIRLFVFITTKDVLFGGAFLLTFLSAADMCRDRAAFFSSRRRMAGFLIPALFMCFLRNQGIYVFLFFGIIFLCTLIREKRMLLTWTGVLILVTGCYLSFNGPLLDALGVEKGDAREMLSVPMQQIARMYHKVPELLTPEELLYIETLILPENLEQYVSVNADPVKSGFQTEVVKADPGRFLKFWATLGMKKPIVYWDSFLMGNWGYWYPGESQYWIHYIEFDGAFLEPQFNILNIGRASRLPEYESYLRDISLTPAFEDVFLLRILLNQAFPFWLMLAAAAALLCSRRYDFLLPLMLFFGYWGTLLLGPVTSVRYALPLMVCVPALFAIIGENLRPAQSTHK